jgi:hypothetical protein
MLSNANSVQFSNMFLQYNALSAETWVLEFHEMVLNIGSNVRMFMFTNLSI